jgi:hypothetical protein
LPPPGRPTAWSTTPAGAAPQTIQRLIDLGSDLGQLTRTLGTRSTLTVAGNATAGWRADHTLTRRLHRRRRDRPTR